MQHSQDSKIIYLACFMHVQVPFRVCVGSLLLPCCATSLLPCLVVLLLKRTNLYCYAGRYAVGTRGWLNFQGSWAWSLKNYIDRAFMDNYGSALPFDKVMAMLPPAHNSNSSSGLLGWLFGSSSSSQQQLPGAFAAAGSEGAALFAASAMRCGGCGAKVGSSTLSRVLKRIKTQQQQQQQQPTANGEVHEAASTAAAAHGGLLQQVQLGADDAAVLPPPPPGQLLVSTVDFFRAFWPDAYLLGKIAANHALGVSLQNGHCCIHTSKLHCAICCKDRWAAC
jgi:hypothetical protein